MTIFEDKISIVTGAASGIGKALSHELAKRGAKVIATDINIGVLQEAMESVKSSKHKVETVELDVTDYKGFETLIDETVSREGRLDYLFNNAGIAMAGEVRDQEIEHWEKVLDVNLNGVIYGSVLAYKQMVKQGAGHIVNLSSVEGMTAFPATVPYVVSKFAVMGLSQGMWVEGADLGVTVSAVCPGFIKTPIFEVGEVVNTDRKEMLKSLSTFEKFAISPEKCAKRILKGVAKKKVIIPITGLAWVLWWFSRLKPTLLLNLTRKDFRKIRDKARIKT